MGCQNSQVGDLAPQPPHVLEQDDPSRPHQPGQPPIDIVPPADLHKESPQPPVNVDKENLQPHKQVKPSRQQTTKPIDRLTDSVSEAKKKSKSEKLMEEMKLVDTTNCPKENLVMESQKKKEIRRQSKVLSARSSYKAEEQNLGPSSKTIEGVEEPQPPNTLKAGQQLSTGEEGFPITKVLRQESTPSIKINQAEGSAAKGSEKMMMQPFILEEWQGSASLKENLNQKQVLQEEVSSYLQQIWAYEKDVVDAVITRLQERQMKKYSTES